MNDQIIEVTFEKTMTPYILSDINLIFFIKENSMRIEVELEDIERRIFTEIPVTIYRLKEGETHEDISYTKYIHGWKLKWVETGGTNYKGRLIVVPDNKVKAKMFQKVLTAFYLSLGFGGELASLLSKETIKHFWDTTMWSRVKYIHDNGKVYTGNTLTDINSELQRESDIFSGMSNTQLQRVLELVDRVNYLSV